ncbi:DUF995 domain-containing protein [Ruegeria arenilitoris]|uniref:DUF995 domain-containing protein n=2 Tax=Ruegeria arenilitoris TaxID=1173585 RepID=UPI0014804BA5|nr:DUF995 domain-containing protein [Ruegeria arenilitoris]
MTMKLNSLLITALGATLLATSAFSESKPNGAKNADPQQVIDIYLGKTWNWSKGGSYWGSGGKFQAVWDDDPSDPAVSYTDGKWYVTSKGTLCYESVWHWTGKDKADEVLKNCWRHVIDKDGQVWRSDHRDQNDFHKLDPDKIANGNKIKPTYNKYKKMVNS